MSTTTVVNGARGSKRRTRRIPLIARLEVSGEDQTSSFTVTTTATNLNRNGAALHLNRDLSVGSVVVVQNSRGARTPARVVALTSAEEELYTYGVEFLEPESVKDFWGINFPHARKLAQGRTMTGEA